MQGCKLKKYDSQKLLTRKPSRVWPKDILERLSTIEMYLQRMYTLMIREKKSQPKFKKNSRRLKSRSDTSEKDLSTLLHLQEALKANIPEFVKELNLKNSELLDEIFQNDIICQEEFHEITAKPTDESRARLLVNKIRNRPPTDIKKFLQLLREHDKGYLAEQVNKSLEVIKQDNTTSFKCEICVMKATVDIRDISDRLVACDLLAEDVYNDMTESDNPLKYRCHFWESVTSSVNVSECRETVMKKLIAAMGDRYKHITSYLQNMPKDSVFNCSCVKRRRTLSKRPASVASDTDMSTTETTRNSQISVESLSSTINSYGSSRSDSSYVKLREVARENDDSDVQLRDQRESSRIRSARARRHGQKYDYSKMTLGAIKERIDSESESVMGTTAEVENLADINQSCVKEKLENSYPQPTESEVFSETKTVNISTIGTHSNTESTYLTLSSIMADETCRKRVVSTEFDETTPKVLESNNFAKETEEFTSRITSSDQHETCLGAVSIRRFSCRPYWKDESDSDAKRERVENVVSLTGPVPSTCDEDHKGRLKGVDGRKHTSKQYRSELFLHINHSSKTFSVVERREDVKEVFSGTETL